MPEVTLYDHRNNPIEKREQSIPAPSGQEIATTLDGRDITRGYVDSMPLLQSQDSLLQMRGGGDIRIYEEVYRDEQVASTLQQRQLALISRDWNVSPGDNKRKSKQAAEHLKEVLTHIGWDERNKKMLMGNFYGYAVAEPLYIRDGRHIAMDQLKVRKQRRFGFAPDGSLRLKTTSNPMGEKLPERKFWCFNTGSDNDDEPYGLGLAHWLYWPTLFKRNDIKFWLIFLEKFGQPTATGKYPQNAAADEKTRLLNALGAISTDSGVIMPQGMEIELLEAARSGAADYKELHQVMNHAIAKMVLGQVMTSEAVGGQYKGEMQMDVRQDLVKADADLINLSAQRQFGRWLTDWNYPGAAYPKIERDLEDPEDLNARAERDERFWNMGVRPKDVSYFNKVYGGEWVIVEPNQQATSTTGKDADPTGALIRATESQQQATDFAEQEDDTPIMLAKQLDRVTQDSMTKIVNQIKTLVDDSESFEELQEKLLTIYGTLETDELSRIMAQAFATADLTGRFEVDQGE